MEPANFQERCIGLDVLSRSTMKLFVHDVLCLQPIDCLSHKEHCKTCFNPFWPFSVSNMFNILRCHQKVFGILEDVKGFRILRVSCVVLWSSGRHLALGSWGPGFESWLYQVDVESFGKALFMHFPHPTHV